MSKVLPQKCFICNQYFINPISYYDYFFCIDCFDKNLNNINNINELNKDIIKVLKDHPPIITKFNRLD